MGVDPTNMWRGSLVELGAIDPTPEVAERMWRFFRDTAEARLWAGPRFPSTLEGVQAEGRRRAETPPDGDDRNFQILGAESGEFLGIVNAHDCKAKRGDFRYGIAIFPEHRGNGYAGEAIKLMLRYYFGELGYHRVSADVYSFNEGSLAMQRALGFVEEGRIRELIYAGGSRHDQVIFGMTAAEFAERHPDYAPAL